MKVTASISEIELEGDNGQPIDSVEATCSRCRHSTESYGTSQSSVLRCLALLREECPKHQDNFYAAA